MSIFNHICRDRLDKYEMICYGAVRTKMIIRNVTVRQAIDDYMQSEGMQRAARRTRGAHRSALKLLLDVVGPRFIAARLTRIQIDGVLRLARQLGERRFGQAPKEASLNPHRGALKVFVRFLHQAGYLPRTEDPTSHLAYARYPKDDGRKRKPLSVEQALDLLDAAGAGHPRDRAIVALLLFTGMRESELIALTWGDIRWEDEEIVFYRKKQAEYHSAPFSPMLEQELRAWHAWYAARHPEMKPEWSVIPPRKQGKLYSKYDRMHPEWPIVPERHCTDIGKMLKGLYAAVGVADLVGKGAHTMRRTFAHLFYEKTGDIRYVQKALGHSKQSTTEIYMNKDAQYEKNKDAMKTWVLERSERADNVIEFRRAS